MSAHDVENPIPDRSEETPIQWLREELQRLRDSGPAVAGLHGLFAKAMFGVTVQNALDEGVHIRKRESVVLDTRATVRGVVEVELNPQQHPNSYDKPYDYMMVYLNNLFATTICLYYLPGEALWDTIFDLADELLGAAEGFLAEVRSHPRRMSAVWKSINQLASERIQQIFVGQLGWKQKKFRKRLVKLMAHIDPYLLFMPDFHDGPVSVLTTMQGSDRYYLNIPTAVHHPVSVGEDDFDPEFPFCEFSPDAAAVLTGLTRDVFPYWRLPVHNQAGNVHVKPLPRNTQLQLEGRILRGAAGGIAQLAVDARQLRVAAPKQPPNMKYELLNIVKGHVPKANLRKSVPFGTSYAKTSVAMADAICQAIFKAVPERHAFNNVVSNFAPPEPEVIHGMQQVSIEAENGEKRFFYINLPLKDYDAPKVDMVFFVNGHWEFQSFVGANAFLVVLDLLAQPLGLSKQYARSFYDLVEVMEQYHDMRDDVDCGECHERVRLALRFLIRQAASIADFNLDGSSSPQKIEAMLPWFYLLTLSYRYSREKRVREADIWERFFAETCAEFSGPAAKEFEWKWNVFTSMPMQPGVFSSIFNLILMNQNSILGWEGCKSAKDRGTEIKVFECFNWNILFTCSCNGDNSHLRVALYHSAMHFKICLQFFSHATGVMPCGEYSRNHPDALPSEISVLGDLDQALRILRKIDPETGKPARPNLATYRNKVFKGEGTKYERALKSSVRSTVFGGVSAVASSLTALVGVVKEPRLEPEVVLEPLVTTIASVEAASAVSAIMASAAAVGGIAFVLLLVALYYYQLSRRYAPNIVKVSDLADAVIVVLKPKVRRAKARTSAVALMSRVPPATPSRQVDTKSNGAYTSLGDDGTPGREF